MTVEPMQTLAAGDTSLAQTGLAPPFGGLEGIQEVPEPNVSTRERDVTMQEGVVAGAGDQPPPLQLDVSMSEVDQNFKK